MDLRFLLLLVCFFVSGFAALLYQTAWTREFAFLFGTSELAVVAVLSAYMGGLALGAAVAARVVRRLSRPVLAYGLLELGIALGALAVPFLIRAVQSVYIAVAGGLEAPPETMALTTALFHLVGSFVVLVPCTALMGATLPLLARYAVSEDAQVGPRIGVLYAVNTFGAIAGTLVAAFLLLPEIGLRQTVYVGIAGNAIVFLAAAALARGIAGVPTEHDAGLAGRRGVFHWILPAMTLSGAVSFVYEVLWTRLLGQVLGGSTAAFASMLASFLLGIALGSAVASRFAKTREGALRGFALAQIGAGLAGYAAFRAADQLPALAQWVGAHPAAPAPGAAAAGVMLLPVTLCIGATFPFGVRLLAKDADEAAAVSGRVYAWNTVGSIVGAISAGFFLLPHLGLENTALVGVCTSLGLAILAALATSPKSLPLAGIAGVALAASLVVGLPRPVDLLLHSAISGTRMAGDLYYLGVGRSATVTVVENQTGWRLLTNGLPESGIEREETPRTRVNETAWLSLLPTAARPATDDMLIIGLGGAKTLEGTATSVSSIDVIELEEEVVIANRLIPRPKDPLADPRVTLRLGDARGAMNLSKKSYDAIVSQPSHPWTSGASHLYTREFFELVRSKLEPEGIFVQWIGQGFVDVPLFGSLMAAMTDVFAYVHVYRPVPVALVFVASNEPIDVLASAEAALAAAPESFAAQGIHRPEDLLASWSLDTKGVAAFSEGRPQNTDDHNRLATTRLPPAVADRNRADFNEALDSHDVYLEGLPEGIEPVSLLRRMGSNGEFPRAQRLAGKLDTADSLATRGFLLFDRLQVARARALFRQAIDLDEGHAAARAGVIATRSADQPGLESIAWQPTERTVIEAQRLARDRRWDDVAALDDALGRIAPGDLLFSTASSLRALWRIATDDPARGDEALVIIDTLLTRDRKGEHFLLRAQAGGVAGRPAIAWAALDHLSRSHWNTPNMARRALAVSRRLGQPPEGSTTLDRFMQASRARR